MKLLQNSLLDNFSICCLITSALLISYGFPVQAIRARGSQMSCPPANELSPCTCRVMSKGIRRQWIITVSGKNPPRIESPAKNFLEDKTPRGKIPPKIPGG